MGNEILPRVTREDTHLVDRPPDSNNVAGDEIRVRADRGSPPRTPRWVKVIGIIALVLVVLVAIVLVIGIGGEHGPSRHAPTGEVGVQALAFRAIEEHSPLGSPAGLGGYALPTGGVRL